MSPAVGTNILNKTSERIYIKDGTVHLWTARLSDWKPSSIELGSIISRRERKRAERLVFPERRDDFILHRGLLRSILAKYLEEKPEQIRITISDSGKPILANHRLEFNLSHSNDLMICGITAGARIGVDIQYIYPIESLDRVISKILATPEIELLNDVPKDERMELFFTIWTAKEALLKALGSGFQSPANTIQVINKINSGSILQVETPLKDHDWIVREVEIESGYKSFLAVEGKEIQVETIDLTPNSA
jgi:4'-phosphopantetheinyl transferase